ncbi:MAG: beta-N-acetylhexosaminidase [Phycisphaerae bacterium]|jgi:beta-N-acetylhexosaminidase|nr:beta-N-acetylhexosaminidase [Phycisphaerae bacterium]
MTSTSAERAASGFMMIGFDGHEVTSHVSEFIRSGAFGVILFARNYTNRDQVLALSSAVKACPASGAGVAVAVDHEGGRVQRFRGPGFTDSPPMRDMTREWGAHLNGPEHRARALGQLFAVELRPIGIDIDFAPVLDVDSNPDNPVIGERAFSHDAEIVAALGAAVIEGLQSGGVAACGKHFPGHGDTDMDSHHHLPRLNHDLERLRRVELVPFRAAIRAQVASIMTSHILFSALDPTRPATMSPVVLRGILRDELGFDGVIVSDDLEMKAIAEHFEMPGAAVEAAKAGCDLLLCCHTPSLQCAIRDALAKAIRDGELSEERVAESERRRATLASRYVRGVRDR